MRCGGHRGRASTSRHGQAVEHRLECQCWVTVKCRKEKLEPLGVVLKLVRGLYRQFGSGGVLDWFSGSAGVLASNGASREGQRVGREREREAGREGEREAGREGEREGRGREGSRKESEREEGREGERICTVPLPYGTVPVLPVLYRYGRYRVP